MYGEYEMSRFVYLSRFVQLSRFVYLSRFTYLSRFVHTSRDGSRYVHGECNVAQHDSASPSKDENREKMKNRRDFKKSL
jgi:hypothetical protein